MAFRLISEGRESVVMPLAAALFGRAVPESPPSLLLGDTGITGCEWGREGTVGVYELLGHIEEDCPVTHLSEYYVMLEAMESGNVTRAFELAAAMTETAPEDGVAAYYRRLLEEKTHAAG